MRVALGKQSGVDSVSVSLNQGRATVYLTAANRLTIRAIRDVVRANGFTPKESEVVARGVVAGEDGRLALVLPGGDGRYAILVREADPRLSGALKAAGGVPVILRGTIPEDIGSPPLRLLVREVNKATP